MVKTIFSKNSPLKEKLKQLMLYLSRRRGAKIVWKRRHNTVFEQHPEYRKPLDNKTRHAHRELWEPFYKNFSDATLQISRSVSGTDNPMIIPEEIFQTDIEPTLNRHPEAHYLGHKSFYNRWFNSGIFPKDLLHIVKGELLDNEYHTVSADEISTFIQNFEYPVVMKPNQETWGGNNIQFVQAPEELLSLVRSSQDAVIQEKIPQHPELSRYHPPSLNTVRVYLYRSVTDNKVHLLHAVLRTGNNTPVDNVTAGGLVSLINQNGYLHGYALDLYGGKHTNHPVTGLPFTGQIPDFEQLKELSVEIAQKLFLLRVVGLDLCYDETGRWRAVEVNTRGHSIRFSQYAGLPFFGEYTEEVLNYCKNSHWTLPE
ncbi:sugar-transfer associated ATP-grasp domain-containing protein [Rhodohalobacter sp. SW132]|uniref:sugar-transfer associated ATP-grasp domain-containing protein n=1 Tax=Rhodohalobacter sp. SW132 TaxID=2293433 RepID=UPI0013155D7A|nr:sugar-transfer associated ATP-grasp domain-containing protein [Rhodohalobacter sp. SW132]